MENIICYKIPPQEKDSTKVGKAIPSVKQEGYFDFNNSDQEILIEKSISDKKIILPIDKVGQPDVELPKSRKDILKSQKKKIPEKSKAGDEGSKKIAKKEKEIAKPNSILDSKKELKNKTEQIAEPHTQKDRNFDSIHFNYDFLNDKFTNTIQLKYINNLGSQDAGYVTSIFSGHKLQVNSNGPISRNNLQQTWVLIVMVFVLFSLAWVKTFQLKKLRQYSAAFFSQRLSVQILREEKPFSERASLQLFLSSLLSISMFIYQLFLWGKGTFYGYDLYSFKTFLIILFLVFFAFILKVLVSRIIGYVFMIPRLASEYVFTILLFFNILGIAFLPIAVGMQYVTAIDTKYFVVAGGALSLLAYLYGLYRVIIIGLGQVVVSKFYLFIYLCTLEIIPIMLIFKISFNLFKG